MQTAYDQDQDQDQSQELRAQYAELEAELCRRSLKTFVKCAWTVVEPGTPLVWNWHLDLLCSELEAVTRGHTQKLLINVPPGTMKSLLASVFWPAWEWTTAPWLKYFCASYGQDLATRDTMKMHDIVVSPWYQRHFGIKFRPDQEQKPVWVEERVVTHRGLERLGDVRVGDEVLTHRGRFRRVLAVHEQGIIPTVEVVTEKGRVVRAAPDHPFLTTAGWKNAGDLEKGDVLVSPERTEPLSGPSMVSDEEARLLGYLVGDGSCTRDCDVVFVNADAEVLEDFASCAEKLGFDARRAPSQDSGKAKALTLHPSVGRWTRDRGESPLLKWRRLHGLVRVDSYSKRIPLAVLRGGESAVRNFLGAYWSCDGSIGMRRLTSGAPGYSSRAGTVSEDLARDLQGALWLIGIDTRVYSQRLKLKTRKQPSGYVFYFVGTNLSDQVHKFAELPMCRRKRDAAAKAETNRGRRGRVSLLPTEDVVRSVRNAGGAECRCLTVEEDASFVAGGIAVHNTWFINTNSGWRIASSVGGRGTGEHPDRRIIDDPHNAQQAKSDAERQMALDWYDQTISTRGVTKGVREVVIMQRLHELDLSGHLLEKGGWRHVMLPMRFEKARACPGDPRTEEGELLWPELFTEEKVRELEISLTEYGAAGQLQQRPAPPGGGLFKREWIRYTDQAPPPTAKFCRAWDVAGTAGGTGARTAGVKIADLGVKASPRFVIVDVQKGRWGALDVENMIQLCAYRDGQSCRVREEQEGGSAGKAVIEARRRLLAGWDYQGVSATGDKETRANNLRAQMEGGEVALLRAPWNEEFVQELEVFPFGRTKDQVDAAAHAFNELVTGVRPAKVGRVRWG